MGNSRKQSATIAILFGINTCVGYAFIIGISSFYNSVGNWFLFFLPLCGLISFVVGICFSKLTLQIEGYGGSYLYVKKAFGRYAATITGFFQYAQVPAICIGIISGILWSFKAINEDFYVDNKNWLVLGAFILFVIFSSILFFGLKMTKYTVLILWILKWAVLLFSLVISLTLISKFGQNFSDTSQLDPSNKTYKPFHSLGISDVISSIILFFFAFGGFENLAAISHDVKNPSKVMPKIIAGLILFATVFYLIYFVCMVGALGSGNHDYTINSEGNANIINNLINKVFKDHFKLAGGVVTGIIITAVLSQMANKLSGRVQSAWVNTRLISPLAFDGIIPHHFAKRDKHGQFRNALYLDFVISFIAVLAYCVLLYFSIPYKDNDPNNQHTPSYADYLDRTLQVYTLTAFTQYILTLLAAVKLAKKKEIILNKFWKITFLIMAGFLLFLTFFFLIDSIRILIVNSDSLNILAFCFYCFVFAAANFFYFYSKKANWKDKAKAEITEEEFLDTEVKLEHKVVEIE
ncbi:APC family permease [symbiont of Argiope bruennichi]|uniref:APC family permease n=1 Tax=symbiont of Argiope bruennichi TaxID=2810479 RepID=UPI003DA55C32